MVVERRPAGRLAAGFCLSSRRGGHCGVTSGGTQTTARGIARTFFGLLAATGMRVGEAVALDQAHVALSEGMLTVHHPKGGRTRFVPIHASTSLASGLRHGHSQPLFSIVLCQVDTRTPADLAAAREWCLFFGEIPKIQAGSLIGSHAEPQCGLRPSFNAHQ
jgi:integrase